jgi:hypothetical protein
MAATAGKFNRQLRRPRGGGAVPPNNDDELALQRWARVMETIAKRQPGHLAL